MGWVNGPEQGDGKWDGPCRAVPSLRSIKDSPSGGVVRAGQVVSMGRRGGIAAALPVMPVGWGREVVVAQKSWREWVWWLGRPGFLGQQKTAGELPAVNEG
jgi:hypothetical protein